MDAYATSRDAFLRTPALAAAAAIEAELRALGWWADRAPPPEDLAHPGPFGRDTLTPAQWLQFILLQRVQEAARGEASFPQGSSVATWAFREFDGQDETHALVRTLHAFDEVFQPNLLGAASAWHPALPALLRGELDLASPVLFDLPSRHDEVFLAAQQQDLQGILQSGAAIDWRHPGSLLSALHVAIAMGCDAAEQVLLHGGADPSLCDAQGLNAADWRLLRLQARLSRLLPGIAQVRSARIAQLYFPNTQQFSTALVALELDGAVPADAFSALPSTDPALLLPLGADGVSTLTRLATPFWLRDTEEKP